MEEGTPEEVKLNIFKRINTGGAPLSAQEIRHALNPGIPADFIKKLANLKSFQKATGKINPKRMLDRDFITRFVAFYLIPYTNYEPDLDSFLNRGMKEILRLSEKERIDLEDSFSSAMNVAYEVYGF